MVITIVVGIIVTVVAKMISDAIPGIWRAICACMLRLCRFFKNQYQAIKNRRFKRLKQ